jgi:deferrochelatase/peroxidase EfeB
MQGGIYWDKGTSPPRCYGIVFMKADRDADARRVNAALEKLVACWNDLKRGTVAALPGVTVPVEDFEWLLGFGMKAFAIAGALKPVPTNIRPPRVFASVDPAGGGLVVYGGGLRYAEGVPSNVATEEFCAQFTGNTPLSVARAIVESVHLLEGLRDPATGRAALLVSASFTGFNREDRRSWIDFHDGISNLVSGDERKSVITIRAAGLPAADKWTGGGTYMAFIRVAVDLKKWRGMGRPEQELIVGRTKLSGCPLLTSGPGEPTPPPGCPTAGTTEITGAGNVAFLEPPDGVDAIIKTSHVQRANHHIVKQRIFRQGYEFIDPPLPGRPLSVGLNFVSFQDDPDRLFFMLRTNGWLGAVNFGGDPGPELLQAIAAAMFLCPPRLEGEAYPGASVFQAAAAGPQLRARPLARRTRNVPAGREAPRGRNR